jgi:hypothetical protein
LIFAPLYVLRATEIDAKQIRRADIVSGNEPPSLSYDNNYSNRLFGRNIFCVAALYSAGLELLSNAKSEIAHPPASPVFFLRNQAGHGKRW